MILEIGVRRQDSSRNTRIGSLTAIITYTTTAGVCSVDPNNNVTESNEANNSCSNTVTVAPEPDLTVAKTNNVSSSVSVNGTFNWVLTISNGGAATASFATTQTILTDNLPNSNATYGTPTVATAGGVTGTVSCGTIISSDLSCTASGGAVT